MLLRKPFLGVDDSLLSTTCDSSFDASLCDTSVSSISFSRRSSSLAGVDGVVSKKTGHKKTGFVVHNTTIDLRLRRIEGRVRRLEENRRSRSVGGGRRSGRVGGNRSPESHNTKNSRGDPFAFLTGPPAASKTKQTTKSDNANARGGGGLVVEVGARGGEVGTRVVEAGARGGAGEAEMARGRKNPQRKRVRTSTAEEKQEPGWVAPVIVGVSTSLAWG